MGGGGLKEDIAYADVMFWNISCPVTVWTLTIKESSNTTSWYDNAKLFLLTILFTMVFFFQHVAFCTLTYSTCFSLVATF